MRQIKLLAGSSHHELAEGVAKRLGMALSPITLKRFSNQETSVEIGVSIRNEQVFIIQSGSSSINDHLMELLIIAQACRGGSAEKIIAVLPYFPYSKQSKMKKYRGAITAKMVANLLYVSGVNHVITMDLHASQMQGFFKTPVDNMSAEPTLARWICENVEDYKEAVVVSKNAGGIKRVTRLADLLNLDFALINTDRRRGGAGISRLSSEDLDETVSSERGFEADLAEEDSSKFPEEMSSLYQSHPLSNLASKFDSASLNGDTKHSNGDDACSIKASPLKPVRSRIQDGVHTGRLVSGHVVDDDHVSMTGSMYSEGGISTSNLNTTVPPSKRTSETDMTASYMLGQDAGFQSAHALGGTIDTAVPSDDEEEHMMLEPLEERVITLVGNVAGRVCIILDDMIDSAISFVAAAEHLVKNCGASEVICMATHGIFLDDALEMLVACEHIHRIVVTNSYPISPAQMAAAGRKLVVIDIGPVLAEAIRRTHNGESVMGLYSSLY